MDEQPKKTADIKKYMREYKKKLYDIDPTQAKLSNRKTYYKHKYGLSKEEANEYGDLTNILSTLVSVIKKGFGS